MNWRWRWIAASVPVWVAILVFGILRPPGRPASPPTGEEEGGVSRLGPPKPGEWRHRFREDEQTFENYIAGPVNRKRADRSTFYLQPLGKADERYRETLERLRIHAEAFFGVPARVLEAIPLPDDAFASDRDQYNASTIIEHLIGRLPPDALSYMGITEKDLYAPGLNFVFGQGSLQERCGVYSLTRYETPDAPLFLRRSLKLLSHEAGHILSLHHCVTWTCVMQGSNTLAECDVQPMHLCPMDLRKVLWNTGAPRDDRYRRLQSLYREWGLDPEARWVGQRLAGSEK